MEKYFEFCVLVNNYCNINCPYCSNFMPAKMSGPKYDLTVNMAKYIFRTIKYKLKSKFIWHLFGGETILSPNYADLTELFVNDSDTIQVKVSTNGTIPFSDRAVSILQNDKVLVRVTFHIDALSLRPDCDKQIETIKRNVQYLLDNGVKVYLFVLANDIEGERAISFYNMVHVLFGNRVPKIYLEPVINNQCYVNPFYDVNKYSALYEKTTKFVYPYRSLFIHSDMGLTYRCAWVKQIHGLNAIGMNFNNRGTWDFINRHADYKFDCQCIDCDCKVCLDCDGE